MNTNWTEKQVSELFDAYDDWVENDFGYQPLIADLISSCGKSIEVLDYGCGSGKVSRRLRANGVTKVTGVDIAPTMITKAVTAGGDNLDFIHITGPVLPFEHSRFDAAISCFLFINIPQREELIKITKEVARVLKPGGTYYILDTHPLSLNIDYPTYRNGVPDQTYSDGDDRPVFLKVPGEQSLEIIDKHWELETYRQCFADAGLELVTERELPFDLSTCSVHSREFEALQGTHPYILFKATKTAV